MSPSPFAQLLERARTLDAEALLQASLDRWMHSSGMSVQSWAILDAFTRKEGLTTLEALLSDQAAEGRLLDWRQGRQAAAEVCRLIEHDLTARRGELDAPDEVVAVPPPPLGRPRLELEAWATAWGVSDWLQRDARRLETQVGGDAGRWLWWYGDDEWSLGRLLEAERSRSARGSRTTPPLTLQEAARRYLHEGAVAAATGVRFAAQAAVTRAALTPDPRLAPLQAQLLAVRGELASAGAGPLAPSHRGSPQAHLVDDPPTLEVALQPVAACPGHRDARIVIDLTSGMLHCRCARPEVACAARLAVVDLLLDTLTGEADTAGVKLEELARVVGTPRWQRDLDVLDDILSVSRDVPIGWRVRSARGSLTLEPVAVTNKKGGGSKLTLVGLEAALDGPRPSDRRAATLLAPERAGAKVPRALVLQALETLTGHPHIYGPGRSSRPTAVVTHPVGLVGRPSEDGVRFQAVVHGVPRALPLEVLEDAAGGRALWHDGTTLRLLRVSPKGLAVVKALSTRQSSFPESALDAVFQRLPRLASLLELRLEGALAGESEPPSPTAHLRLESRDGTTTARLSISPAPGFADLLPSDPSMFAYRRESSRTRHVQRDRHAESTALQAAQELLGDLSSPLTLEEALDLALLAESSGLTVQWDGPSPDLVGEAGPEDLSVSVQRRRDWFGLEGTLAVGDHQVPLRELLRAVREGRHWLQLEDGSYAKLSDALRARLTEAVSITQPRRSALRVEPLHASVIAGLSDAGASVTLPPSWHAQAARVRAAATLTPETPEGLTATLRGYQREGFVWLARLAEWAPGAVLADDMGLGKTLQALTLLLRRAAGGPALVVAPTSVGFNWIREAARFAPDLDVTAYRGPTRTELLEDLRPGLVLVTSYALLRRDADLLQDHDFHTVVLDEAQAIKNPTTAAARAAHGLRRAFCLALTGTPIENRIGELWSLFRATVPGLLGSHTAFRERWVHPIERAGDKPTSARLARLIAPFLLRRRKETVASDLPARMEMLVEVELSDAERELYEQERIAAARRLVARGTDGDNHQRMAVLAALTRLRQLACHPRLVDSESAVTSSKLRRVRQLIREGVDAGHRALIFSQFTRHLSLVRDALEEDGVTTRYLDGSTAAEQRQREVDSFQRGEGDVFLISLKAGGTGLNLTAASFVVHLDPWWNPAAEDQATDRAHRIGQTKHVTVYRVIAMQTVEEAILQLHEEKRALADSVIGGAARTRLETHELLELLATGG